MSESTNTETVKNIETVKTKEALSNMDILTELVYHHLTLDSSRALLDACDGKYIDKQTADEIYKMRVSLHKLFEPIVEDVEIFLEFMISNSITLVGRRAVGFMYPFIDVSGSSWDFFCLDSGSKLYTLYQNMKGIEITDGILSRILIRPGYYVGITSYTIIKNDVESKVRFITTVSQNNYIVTPLGVMDYILSLPCTADQCFLTGYAAVSLYDTLTARRLMIEWVTNSQENRSAITSPYIKECNEHIITTEYIMTTDLNGYINTGVLSSLNNKRYDFLCTMSGVPNKHRHIKRSVERLRLMYFSEALMSEQLKDKKMQEILKMIVDLITTDCRCIYNDDDTDVAVQSLRFYTKNGFRLTNPKEIKENESLPINVKRMFTRLENPSLDLDLFPSFRSIQSGSMSRVVSLSEILSENMIPMVLPRLERLFAITWHELILVPCSNKLSEEDMTSYVDASSIGHSKIAPGWTSMGTHSMRSMLLDLIVSIVDNEDVYDILEDQFLDEVSNMFGHIHTRFGI